MPDPVVNSIQVITSTLPSGSSGSGDNTNNVTISSVNTSQTILIPQAEIPNNARTNVVAELLDATTIRFHRYDDRSATDVTVYVVEFDSSVSVQRGYSYDVNASNTISNAISSVNVSNSFALLSVGIGDRDWGGASFYYPSITSSTNLNLIRDSSLSESFLVFYSWQVVEMPSGSVQSGVTSFATTDTQQDVTISSVTEGNAFVLSAITTPDNTEDIHAVPDVYLTSGTNLRIARATNGGSNINVAWQVIENPAFNVQEITSTFTDSSSSQSETITSVDTSVSFALCSMQGPSGNSGPGYVSTTASHDRQDWRSVFVSTEITSATALNFSRGNNTVNALHRAYVVEVAAASGSTVTASYAEGIDFGDTYSTTATLAATYNDGISLADAYVRTALLQAAFTDGISTSDDPARVLTMQSALAEGAQLGDLVDAIVGLIKAIQEGIDIGDSFTATAALQAAIADGLNLGDTATATALYNALVAEGVDFSDTVTGEVISAGVISGALVDALVFADAMTVTAVLQAVYGEGFDIGDTFTASVAGTITGALSDGLVMSDSMVAALQLVASLSEGLTFADVFTATVQAGVITGSLSEGVIFSSTFIANTILRGTVSEGMDFSDTVTFPSLGRYLVATISLYAALSAASTTISPGLNASSINIKPD